MIRSLENQETVSAAPWKIGLAIVVIASGFFLVEHELFISQRVELGYANDLTALEKSAESGAWTNKVGFSLIGLLGCGYLMIGAQRQWRVRNLMAAILFVGLAWLYASVIWSADPVRTVKNLVIASFLLIGAAGIARQFTGRQFVVCVWGVSTAFLIVGIAIEIALGTFQPWNATYRFAGTLHPNGAGPNCVFCALTSFLLCCESHRLRQRVFFIALTALAAALLYCTRSRSTFAAFTLALSLLIALRLPLTKTLLLGFAAFWTGSFALLVATAANAPIAERLVGVFLMGRTTQLDSLNGRAELWDLVFHYIEQRPVTGYGYAGFWREDVIAKFAAYTGWSMNSAHSMYLDCVLGLGYVGLGLLVVALVAGGGTAAWQFARHKSAVAGLAAATLLFGSATGLTESSLYLPSFATFIAIGSVLATSLFRHVECRDAWRPDVTGAFVGSARSSFTTLRPSLNWQE
ncbi:MAG: O-antigen ligase family protein [Planctomycetales bacterium]|nr:O-antigen ligase family protein [Planctomycetales bacterium]